MDENVGCRDSAVKAHITRYFDCAVGEHLEPRTMFSAFSYLEVDACHYVLEQSRYYLIHTDWHTVNRR